MNKAKVPAVKDFRMYLMREDVDILRMMNTPRDIKIVLLKLGRKDAVFC